MNKRIQPGSTRPTPTTTSQRSKMVLHFQSCPRCREALSRAAMCPVGRSIILGTDSAPAPVVNPCESCEKPVGGPVESFVSLICDDCYAAEWAAPSQLVLAL